MIRQLTEKVAAYIERNPGQRMENLSTGLGEPRSALIVPIERLTSSGRVATQGIKRGTTYWPAPAAKAVA